MPADRGRVAHSLVVVAALAGATWLAAAFVSRSGGPTPVHDDLVYFDLQLDPAPPPLAELWRPFNEHRLPLPKLTSWAVARVFGYDLLAQMRVNLALIVASAAVLTLAARRIRGGSNAADAFFALLLVNPGHWENLIWAVQINFALPLFLNSLLIALVATAPAGFSPRRAAAVGVSLLMLAGSGVQGLVSASALGAWAVGAGLGGAGRGRWVALALGVAALVVAATYLLARPPTQTPFVLDRAALRYALRVVASGWGPAGGAFAADSPVGPVLGAATALFAGVTAVMALANSRDGRLAGTGLALFLAAGVLLCAGVGAARASVWGDAVQNRYSLLAAPTLGAIYLGWMRFGPARAAVWVTAALAAAALALAWPNVEAGRADSRHWAVAHWRVARDIRAGVPMPFLAEYHRDFINSWPPNGVPTAAEALARLRAAGVRPFDRVVDGPPLRPAATAWRLSAASPADALGPGAFRARFDPPDGFRGLQLGLAVGAEAGEIEFAWRDATGTQYARRRLAPGPQTVRLWTPGATPELAVRWPGLGGVRLESLAALVE